jgi:hypothetical protein
MDNDSTVFIGLDVHKDSIAIARVGSATSDPVIDIATIRTRQYAIERMLAKLSGHGPLQFVYEAGPCSLWLQRYLTAVHIQSPAREAFRDVVRAWQQSKRPPTGAKGSEAPERR